MSEDITKTPNINLLVPAWVDIREEVTEQVYKELVTRQSETRMTHTDIDLVSRITQGIIQESIRNNPGSLLGIAGDILYKFYISEFRKNKRKFYGGFIPTRWEKQLGIACDCIRQVRDALELNNANTRSRHERQD